MITIQSVSKEYKGGFRALSEVSLSIQKGEIFALLGPNGAGKTTLISMICGLNTISSGQIHIGGHDIEEQRREARRLVGLVPQELTTDMFETVWDTVCFSRGLFGLAPDDAYIEDILKKLSLWDKKDNRLMTLSGGMKRRVMIAKALSHHPQVLFLDEPTAGVDVELRKDMWQQIHLLRQSGVTIILTTHYIEEAEEMADRIGIINKGQLILVEDKDTLIRKLGKKQILLTLDTPITTLPEALEPFHLTISGETLIYDYDSRSDQVQVSALFDALNAEKITYRDIETKERSLEEIFVDLVAQS